MLLSGVYAKTLRDRGPGMAIGSVIVVLSIFLGLAISAEMNETLAEFTAGVPEALLSMMGVGASTNYVLAEMFNLIAPLVLAGLAISIGTSGIAGEERSGTIGVLLANPRSRVSVLLAKVAAMVSLVLAGGLVVWGGFALGAAVLGQVFPDLTLPGLILHLTVLALFFGAFAAFVGAVTGNTTATTGAGVGVLIVSFLAAGLLPLVEQMKWLVWIFPWYYFNGSQPMTNGVHWGHVGILVGASAILIVASVAAVSRRDLKVGERSRSLLDRLRNNPGLAKVMAVTTGQAHVSNIAVKTFSESRGVIVITGAALFFFALAIGPMFNGIVDIISPLLSEMPEAMLAMVGYADMSTPAGWYHGEMFSFMAPGGAIVVCVMMGVRALAGEEEARTMGLLMASPISRSRVVVEKAVAMVAAAIVLGVTTFLGTMAGSFAGGLGLSAANTAAASAQSIALGTLFGAFALMGGAASGKKQTAIYAGAGLSVVSWVVSSFFPASPRLVGWARLSPFYYDNQPVINGMNWGNLAILAGASVVLVILSAVLFQRRDHRG